MYKQLSDFIKNMCYLNTDSVNTAQVAILCGEEELSWELAKPLFTNQIEFNYLERELLPECSVAGNRLNIAKQSYSMIVSDAATYEDLDSRQKEIVQEFVDAGGAFILAPKDDESYLEDVKTKIQQLVIFDGDTAELRFSHFVKENEEVLILCNEGMEKISVEAKVTGKNARFDRMWNPYTREIREITSDHAEMTIEGNDLWVVFGEFA
jgi:hypothetical protein